MATDVRIPTNVMARGHAQERAGAKELQDHQKTPTITMMKPRAIHQILATHVKNSTTITVMERGHAQNTDGAKEQLAEGQMIQKTLSPINLPFFILFSFQ